MNHETITRRLLLQMGVGAGVMTASSILHASSPEDLSLTTALGISGAEAPLFLALKKNWYRDAGINLKIAVGRGSAYAFQLASVGTSDLAEGTATALAVGIQRGMAFKSFYAITRRSDFAMLVDKDSEIRGPADLRGKRILCFSTSPWVPFIEPYLKRGGLTRNDVTIMMVESNAVFATYIAGTADALLTIPSYTMPLVEKKRPSRALASSDVGIYAAGTGMAATPTIISKRADVLRKFVAVTGRAVVHTYQGNEDEAAAATVEARPNDKLDIEKIRAQITSRKYYITSDNTENKPVGWQSEKDWGVAIASMEEAGLLKKGTRPEDLFTNEFFDANSPVLKS